jgi:hypothetical protein
VVVVAYVGVVGKTTPVGGSVGKQGDFRQEQQEEAGLGEALNAMGLASCPPHSPGDWEAALLGRARMQLTSRPVVGTSVRILGYF